MACKYKSYIIYSNLRHLRNLRETFYLRHL